MYVCVCIFFSIVWNTFWLGLASFFLDFIVMCHDTYLMMINYSESESHSVMSNSLPPYGLYSPWNSPDQNTGVGSLSLLQGIFSTQGLNPGLPHCRQIFYQLSHKGSPKVTLNWSLIESSISTKRKRKFLLNKAKTARVLNYNSGSRS